ncbi:hypothetical protein [Ralstonia syzygii]|uniref:hypothetical protein n=1 Tax=Ralstonia syzygii TaxID=28097 RepID=UPI0018D018BF|nr:hypothetical protein [Ralstonia syzygii]
MADSATAVEASRKAIKEHGDEALAAFNKQARSAEGWLTALQKQALRPARLGPS